MTHSIVAKSGDSPVNVGCPQYLPRRPSNGCVDSSRQSYAMLRCSSKTKRVIDGLSIAASAVLFVLTLKRVTYAGQERCSLAQRNQLGVFQGNSPFDLLPLELLQPPLEGPGAWPIANPVLEGGPFLGSLANPFLFPTEDSLYVFYEETACSSSGKQISSIRAAESKDGGVTWQPLGLALPQGGSISKPFVLAHENQVYMVPDSPESGEVKLFRATHFPRAWELVQTLLEAPLHSVSLAAHNSSWWLFGSRSSSSRSRRSSRHTTLEIYRAPSPLGPWRPHATAPVAADMFSRVVELGGRLLRLGRPCDGGRCGGPAAFEITLSHQSYEQHQLPSQLLPHSRQLAAWDGAGHTYMDLVQLDHGRWLAVATGSSGPDRLAATTVMLLLLGRLWQAVACLVVVLVLLDTAPRLALLQRLLARTNWGQRMLARSWQRAAPSLALAASGPVAHAPTAYVLLSPAGKARHRKDASAWLSRRVRGWGLRLPWRSAALTAAVAVLVGGAAVFQGVHHALTPFWRPVQQLRGADGRYSKFTLMVMSYDKRLESLKHYVQHYSQCQSVGEVLVVWNKGTPPAPKELGSQVPVRVRVEKQNSMNNRYKPDPEILFRAVLSLDDDIMMPCSDVELGFALWRKNPDKIVGYYPRLVTEGSDGRLRYSWEDSTVRQGEYNALLTGAAFLDSRTAFALYWADEVAPARQLVDDLTNCDDLLMNWVIANASLGSSATARGSSDMQWGHLGTSGDGHGSSGRGSSSNNNAAGHDGDAALLFVRPERRFDVSYLSGVGLSHDPSRFQRQAEQCLASFVTIFGRNPLRSRRFDWDRYSPPYCGWPATRTLGCFYL